MHIRNRVRPVIAMAVAFVMVLSGTALAAIEFVQYGTGMTNPTSGNASTMLRIDKPDGLAVGDFMLAQVTFETGRTAGTDAQITPSGWTLIRRTNAPDGTTASSGSGTDLGQALFYRFATSSDISAANFTFPFNQSQKAAGAILRYTGVDPTNPIVDSSGRGGASGNLLAPGVNAEANSMVVALFGLKKSGTNTLPAPAGMTERVLFQNPQDVKIRAADQKWGSTTGPTGDRTSNPSVQEKWVAQMVTLREAAPTQTPNTAPAYTAPVNQTAEAGQDKAFNVGSFTDPDNHDAWDVTVDWGDGSANTFFTVTQAGSLGTHTHTYATAGEKTVTVQVSDRVTSHQGTFKINVSAAPVVDAPTVGYTLTPSTPNGNNDWYRTGPVTLAWQITGTSPTLTGCVDQNILVDQAKATYACKAENSAGSDEKSVVIGLDSTAPSITDNGPTATPNGNSGWYTSPVTNRFTASDATSGLPGGFINPFTKSSGSDEGAAVTVNSGPVSDVAGNTNNGIDSAAFKIDLSNPYNVAFAGGPANGGSYHFGDVPAAPTGCTAQDDISGLAGCQVSGYSAAVGNHTLTATATDNAGRTATATRAYTVLPWNAQGHGFYQPVGVANSVFVAAPGAPPAPTSTTVWNTAKGGSTVPLKFNVYAGSAEKTSTSDITGFTASGLTCPGASAATDDVEFVTTGNTSLRYDTMEKEFIQNWKTPSVSKDSCYRSTVTFADGSHLSAFFRLRK